MKSTAIKCEDMGTKTNVQLLHMHQILTITTNNHVRIAVVIDHYQQDISVELTAGTEPSIPLKRSKL